MEPKYLVDTNVFLDALRGVEAAHDFLAKESLVMSCVSAAELIEGCKNKKDLQIVTSLCNDFEVLPIDHQISSLSLSLIEKFYLKNGLEFMDALVASSAISAKLSLVTNNVKHFKFIPDLKLVDWKF